VKGFKDGMKDGGDKAADPAAPAQQVAANSTVAKETIDVEAKAKH